MFAYISQLTSNDRVLAVLLSLLAAVAHVNGFFSRWDNQYYDSITQRFFAQKSNRDIVIVAIDDRSLGKIGRWPWPRSVHAEFIEKIAGVTPKAIGYDVIFAEPDLVNPEQDQMLLAAVKLDPDIVFPVFPEFSGRNGTLKPTEPWLELARVARLGHTDIEIDSDGIARSVYLHAGMDGKFWPAFALSLYDPKSHEFTEANDWSIQQTASRWLRRSHVYIPFGAATRTFSFIDILENKELLESLRDKFVIVGISATGLSQGFYTPVSKHQFMSGIEFHANVLNALIQKSTISELTPLHDGLATFLLVFLSLSATSSVIRMQPLLPILAGSVAAFGLSILLATQMHVRYDPVSAICVLFASYLLYSKRSQQLIAKLLFREKAKSNATLNSIGDAVISTDNEGFIEYLNPAAERLTACRLQDVQGQPIESLMTLRSVNGNAIEKLPSIPSELIGDSRLQMPYPCVMENRAGKKYIVRISADLIRDSLKHIVGMVIAISDISDTFKISQKMAYLATHDLLTGLPNRSLFHDRLEQAINNTNRSGCYFAVLFIDLDGFKKINDGLGHLIGDRVLKEIAARLRTDIREKDTISRWGGDEFIVLLTDLKSEDIVTRIAEKIRAHLQPPIDIGEHNLFVSPSIGISIYPKDGFTTEVLVTRADAAMYKAKETGGNTFCFFSKELNQKARQRLILEKEMHNALQKGEFEVFYQPQIDLKTYRIVGAEALIRWNHQSRGYILPQLFLPIAEEVGLINPIGEWVLNAVCEQMARWKKMGFKKIKAAVNLSPRQFLQDDLGSQIRSVLCSHGVDPAQIELEITESLMIKNVERICDMLYDIKSLGVSIAVDDFGTGYSSLSFLKRFPIDQLKIDKSFIGQLTTDSPDANIANALISLAHNLKMSVVAEGVETHDQLQFLSDRRCDIGQGFFFSKPVNAQNMTLLLSDGYQWLPGGGVRSVL